MSVMGMTIGQQAEMYANSWDKACIIRLERRSIKFAKEEKSKS